MASSWELDVSRSTTDWASSIAYHGQPLVGAAVGGQHGGGLVVEGDDKLVEVGGLGGVHRLWRDCIRCINRQSGTTL